MKNVLLECSYDGTYFEGFQRQEGKRTVQGVLQDAIEQLTKRPTRLIAAGRTDAGVHARQQWINFLDASTIAGRGFAYHLMPLLPPDILVHRSQTVDSNFHARFAVQQKTYCYTVVCSEVVEPWKRHFEVPWSYPVDWDALAQAMALFVGTRNFSGFSLADPHRSAVRSIDAFDAQRRGDTIQFTVQAQSFLRHQVRMMIGAVLEAACHRLSLDQVQRVLQNGSTHPVARTMPACGLNLSRITWRDDILDCLEERKTDETSYQGRT